MVYGIIDIQMCADVVSRAYMDNMVPMAAIIGVLGAMVIVLLFFFIYKSQDVTLMKGFLQKEKLLKKFEDWKKDRKLE